MAKKHVAKSKQPPAGMLQDGFTWRLSDPGMGLLERAGLAALYMSLRAADEQGKREELAPLTWDDADLTPESVTIRSTEDDKSALTKLFEWAWQVKDGVLYLPAVDRTAQQKDSLVDRVNFHNGILATLFQHNKSRLDSTTNEKAEIVNKVVSLDEDVSISISYQHLRFLKPLHDLDEIFAGAKSHVTDKEVRLSSWVRPGMTNRYPTDATSWKNTPCRGTAEEAILWMLAPIACFYSRLQKERGTWAIILPDIRDLNAFDTARCSPLISIGPKSVDVASLSDAALRFLSVVDSQAPRRELKTACRVVALGKVGYYQSQSIRKSVVDVAATEKTLRRYRILLARIGNGWVPRKEETSKAGKSADDVPKAKGYYSVPSVRGRITDNLITNNPWYTDLSVPLRWDMDDLERIRKRQGGKSVEAIWFNNLTYQRSALVELIRDDEMWDDPEERVFVESFWEVIGLLYNRERISVGRGGTRSWFERCADLDEEMRRMLSRAQTRTVLREVLADLASRPLLTSRADPEERRPLRSKTLKSNPARYWRLIDKDWKRGRDLALLALASYQSKEKRSGGDDSSNSESRES